MGCGRVGAGLARELEASGHSVSIIDQNREAFRRLGADFKGMTVSGVGFDRDILLAYPCPLLRGRCHSSHSRNLRDVGR